MSALGIFTGFVLLLLSVGVFVPSSRLFLLIAVAVSGFAVLAVLVRVEMAIGFVWHVFSLEWRRHCQSEARASKRLLKRLGRLAPVALPKPSPKDLNLN